MPPITKDQGTLTIAPDSTARPGAAPVASGEASKQQPVALEVSVTVNGARTIDGSDKREPFSETTKTVLVFGNGAVIRLVSSVAPGQLLFLTNERTKKEVVCQVVKSKNYRNVSGYVELEFTEPVVGFWGMRFPGDRLGSPAPSSIPPAAVSAPPRLPRPVAPRIEEPALNSSPSVIAPPPAPPKPAPVASFPASSLPNSVPSSPQTSSPAASIVPPPIDSASLLGASKPRPTEVAPPPLPPVAVVPPVAAPPVAVAPPVSAPGPLAADPVSPPPPVAPVFEISSRSDEPASFLAPGPQAPKPPATIDLSSLAPFFEVKPAVPAAVPPPPPVAAPPPHAPAATNPETEALKQHTARLQEQLSSMLFTEPSPSVPAASKPAAQMPTAPASEKKELQESIAQVLEIAKAPTPKPEPVFALPAEPAKVTAEQPKIASLEEEELKIPAWLEPLARNSAAPSSTQELVQREKAKRFTELPKKEEAAREVAAPETEQVRLQQEESVAEPRMPEFGSALVIDEEIRPVAAAPKGSGKGLLFGAIAAGVVLLAAGGWWYLNQRPTIAQGVNSQTQAPAVSSAATNSPAKSHVEAAQTTNALPPADSSAATSASPTQANVLSGKGATTNPASELSTVAAVEPVRNSKPSSNSTNAPRVVTTASAAQPAAVPAEVKKPVLGEVHLAAPKVSQNRNAQSATTPDEGVSLSDDQPNNTDSLGSGLAVDSKQPSAPSMPVPVGGDVKQAKLISSVSPIYPALAKNQHIQGAVTIDALIDATGRVTTMKIISGPTLLHQAAMDALRQWKYQPATLDGKPVPMYLTVTLQFRLQQ